MVLATPTLELKNMYLCKLTYCTLSERFGTKQKRGSASSHHPNKYRSHNSKLKKLRKQKIQTQRYLRQAQRERKSREELRQLGLQCHKAVRAYNKEFNKRGKALKDTHTARIRRECNQSFWKFASCILDNDDSGPFVSPAFDAATAEKYFKEIYSSQNHYYFQPI